MFLTAWLVEKSLSVDNLFVFLVIFGRLKIPRSHQHGVLFWGIVGAFVTRALFIAAGSAVLSRWHFATYVLGGFLVFTGLKTLRSHPEQDGKESRILGYLQRKLPFTTRMDGGAFTLVENGKRVATPLLAVVVAIEAAAIPNTKSPGNAGAFFMGAPDMARSAIDWRCPGPPWWPPGTTWRCKSSVGPARGTTSRTARVSTVRWNLKEAEGKALA